MENLTNVLNKIDYMVQYLTSDMVGSIGENRRILFPIYYKDIKETDGIFEPVIIIEVKDENIPFSLETMFEGIIFELCGVTLEKITSSDIKRLPKEYKEITQIGKTIYLQLPIYSLLDTKGIYFNKCQVPMDIRIIMDFTNNPNVTNITKMSLKMKLLTYL